MAMDLPKGIVVNSPGISSDVERINEEPVASETIAHFWKVYTTTKRTLRDPTAERLENYWWRIWGSRQRELRGATVAQLFLYISDESTFNGRPLLSKVNRFEGDLTTPRIQNGGNVNGDTSSKPSNTSTARPSSSSKGHKKPVAPMPHPILKKSRGPSNTGPRPTARFISPHGSEDEAENQASNSSNEHVVIRPPTPDSKGEQGSQNLLKPPQQSTASSAKKRGKGHVVTAVAGRRRPAVVRRKSSQEKSAEEQETRQKMEKKSISRDKSPTVQNGQDIGKISKSGSSGGATQQPKSSFINVAMNDSGVGVAGPGPSTQLKARENNRLVSHTETEQHKDDLNEEELEELELQKMLLAEANARMDRRPRPTSGDSQLHGQNRRSMSLSNFKPAGDATSSSDMKGNASVVPRYADALGELDLSGASAPTDTKNADKGKGREKDMLQFPKRAVPSLMAKDPSIDKLSNPPVSKSQSQLALLLHQDRARAKEQNSKGKGKEKQTETESDEGLEMPARGKRKW